MKDWQYDNLRQDLTQLEKQVRKVRAWQDFFLLRVMMVVCWLMVLGIWVAAIVHGLHS